MMESRRCSATRSYATPAPAPGMGFPHSVRKGNGINTRKQDACACVTNIFSITS